MRKLGAFHSDETLPGTPQRERRRPFPSRYSYARKALRNGILGLPLSMKKRSRDQRPILFKTLPLDPNPPIYKAQQQPPAISFLLSRRSLAGGFRSLRASCPR